MPDRLTDETLAAALVDGLRPTRVTLVDHDPRWSDCFAARAAELRGALGRRARLVEHVGSTAVPGLAAKPVVDILVGIEDPDDEPAYLPTLRALGYELRVREPRHRCLRIGDPDEPVNLHCYPPGDDEVRRMLLFRDRLRADAGDRLRYETVKRELAQREWRDMNYYAEAKSPTIAAVLRSAGWPEEQGRGVPGEEASPAGHPPHPSGLPETGTRDGDGRPGRAVGGGGATR
jgi:GrpB-like predicted nucleotidyltransferase (UPF0157 family)